MPVAIRTNDVAHFETVSGSTYVLSELLDRKARSEVLIARLDVYRGPGHPLGERETMEGLVHVVVKSDVLKIYPSEETKKRGAKATITSRIVGSLWLQ